MAAAASSKGRAIAGSFVSRVLAGKAASPRYWDGNTQFLFWFVRLLVSLKMLVLVQFVQDLVVVVAERSDCFFMAVLSFALGARSRLGQGLQLAAPFFFLRLWKILALWITLIQCAGGGKILLSRKSTRTWQQ